MLAVATFVPTTLDLYFNRIASCQNLLPRKTWYCLSVFLVEVRQKQKNTARELLEKMGLKERMAHHPSALSGGEQQRVAIARALANQPRLILADEPTGNLDGDTAWQVLDVLIQQVSEDGLGVLIATHNPDLAARLDRTVYLSNGMAS